MSENPAAEIERVMAHELIRRIHEKMKEDNKIVTGDAYDSWVYEPERHRIVTRDPGMIIQEVGRRPGQRMPPLDAIKAWALAKGVLSEVADDPESRRIYKRDAVITYVGERDLNRKVFLIARKIARDGIPATRPVLRAILEMSR